MIVVELCEQRLSWPSIPRSHFRRNRAVVLNSRLEARSLVAPKPHTLVNAKFDDGDRRDACPTQAGPDLGSFSTAWIRFRKSPANVCRFEAL